MKDMFVNFSDEMTILLGHGSCVTSEGTIEMDASIMDGRDFSTGGVICVQNVKNPIRLSRLIKEKVGINVMGQS